MITEIKAQSLGPPLATEDLTRTSQLDPLNHNCHECIFSTWNLPDSTLLALLQRLNCKFPMARVDPSVALFGPYGSSDTNRW